MKFNTLPNFDDYLSGKFSLSDWRCANYELIEEAGIEIHFGCTRGVIIDASEGYVYKFPENILCSEYNTDEVDIYNKAKKEHLEQFFAASETFCEYRRMCVDGIERSYVVTRCPYCDVDDALSEDYVTSNLSEEERSDYEDCGEFEDYIYDALKQNYPEADVDRLQDFLDENGIGDLHSNNWGFYQGRLVITDYAGFHGGYSDCLA